MEVITNRMDVAIIEAPTEKEQTTNNGKEEVMVALLNDDETTMRHVVTILRTIFSLDYKQSKETMRMAHTSGSAVIGYYSEKKALGLLKQVDFNNTQSGNHLRCLLVDM